MLLFDSVLRLNFYPKSVIARISYLRYFQQLPCVEEHTAPVLMQPTHTAKRAGSARVLAMEKTAFHRGFSSHEAENGPYVMYFKANLGPNSNISIKPQNQTLIFPDWPPIEVGRGKSEELGVSS